MVHALQSGGEGMIWWGVSRGSPVGADLPVVLAYRPRKSFTSTLRRRHVMFEDNEPWPIKCVSCAKEFEQPVRWLKGNNAVRCPLCKVTNKYSNEEFLVALAEAKRGLFDPYGDMVRLYKGA